MRRSTFILAVLVTTFFASCTSDQLTTVVGEKAQTNNTLAINFNGGNNKLTRADVTGGDAAALLNNTFRVYGVTKNGAVETPVFDNYVVNYNGNAGSDSTNTAGWTYLGLNSLGLNPAVQGVKYWDLDAPEYDFVAFSGLNDDNRITSATENSIVVDQTNLSKIFVSDRVTARYQASATGETSNTQYGHTVTLTFKRLAARLRLGIYETVPGYAVKDVRFYYGDNYLASRGTINKIDLASGSPKAIEFESRFNYRPFEERAYMFDHVWRTIKDKFYVETIHGVDWEGYKKAYERYLPFINNRYDFRDMLSEMLGELNASHTGARFYPSGASLRTATLGAFFDNEYDGDGLKVKEVIKRGPLATRNTGIKAGTVIMKIDGEPILKGKDYNYMLDGKAGKRVRLTIVDEGKKKERDVVVKAISAGEQDDLLYKRWVERNKQMVDSLSNGRIAYVHVKAMDSKSYRDVFLKLLNDENRNKDAVIVDDRHNGGGWLHDDLCTLLSGKQYQSFVPRGNYVGKDPWNKWTKPSCVLICEDDYSNGHGFPLVYKTLGIGKLVGAPVAGTMTAVWWETLLDRQMIYGIPQVGCVDMNGEYEENQQLNPDILIYNSPEDYLQGRDRQIEEAVKLMLQTVDKK